MGHLEGVEFIVFDKRAGWREYLRIRRLLADRVFDALLLMQVAMRANLLSLCIRSRRKLGYDAARAKDLHGCFVNERIAPADQQHVVDSFFSFLAKLGLNDRPQDWSLPPVKGADALANRVVDERPLMIISPCSSHVLRNWHAEGYAALADYAAVHYGMKVVICGGRSQTEAAMAADIVALASSEPLNLVGQDTFPEFIELLRRARVLVSPDSGPAHIAAITNTPVLGLYAASNPRRSGPYKSIPYCVDQYGKAAETVLGRKAEALKWGKKIEYASTMSLITVEQVKAKLDFILNEEK